MTALENTGSAPLAVVTGASGAVGRAITTHLTDSGWQVIATYRTNAPGPDAPPATWVHYDSAEPRTAIALHHAVSAAGGPLRAVFACVGAPSSKKPVADTPDAEFTAVYQANVMSLVHTWHALAGRARAGRACVLAVGSDAGRAARPGNGPYSAAKAALESLVVTLAKEEQPHGVRVNLLAPSLIDSPLAHHVMALKGVTDPDAYYAQLPWGRPLTLGEVAHACIDLATGPQWAYATGHIYPLGAVS
ncbi:SDR family NAD(P)-dependent oxidoreductase [Streptomyces sp. NPDC056632]|uniref:SDR family NAD(P)-dependent oxidoreductase n=1 Tax=Streptomyces sp. NPDC056632 TaxID=3345884 RepID=UPI003678AA97